MHAIVGADPHWIDYVAAFGTVLASIVAVGIALWARSREDRLRPALSLVYDGEGDDFLVGLHEGQLTEHRVRMRVANRWGKRSAEDVEVILVRLLRPQFRSMVDGHAFAWSYTHDRDGKRLTRLTVPPGLARSFDLLSLTEPAPPGKSSQDGDAAMVELELEPRPSGGGPSGLQEGTHYFEVALTARDTDTVYYSFRVTFDGKWWSANEIRAHLKVGRPSVSVGSAGQPTEGVRRWLRAHSTRRERIAWRLRQPRASAALVGRSAERKKEAAREAAKRDVSSRDNTKRPGGA